jgi:hypothetical protein
VQKKYIPRLRNLSQLAFSDMEGGKSIEKGLSKDIEPQSLSIAPIKDEVHEPAPRILFASDPREKIRRDEITTLPLARTFSRNSYSSAVDEETARVKRVAIGKTVEPQTRLPTGMVLNCH